MITIGELKERKMNITERTVRKAAKLSVDLLNNAIHNAILKHKPRNQYSTEQNDLLLLITHFLGKYHNHFHFGKQLNQISVTDTSETGFFGKYKPLPFYHAANSRWKNNPSKDV